MIIMSVCGPSAGVVGTKGRHRGEPVAAGDKVAFGKVAVYVRPMLGTAHTRPKALARCAWPGACPLTGRGAKEVSPVSAKRSATSTSFWLRRWEAYVECFTGGQVSPLHQDAFGLTDDVAGAQRAV
jgi:hypothetical protein